MFVLLMWYCRAI